MDTYLDGQKLEPASGGIAGVLRGACLTATDTGRILTRVIADGAPIAAELIDHPPADDAGIGTLEIFTDDTNEVITESLAGASEALQAVKLIQQTAAEKIQAGQIAEAFEPLGSVLETWGAVREIVGQAGELANIDIGRLPVGESTGAALIEDLSVRLGAIREAMAGEDWGGLSDELAYELGDQAEAWRGLVHAMSAKIDAKD
ncbi:MAG: hypothetical protein ACI89L_002736 [Phycisphaerales bacterium]